MLKSSAVILAAGASRRLGYNKLCLRVNGEAVIRKTVRFFVEAEIGEVAVVTGFERERVERELADLPVSFFYNERHEDGMSASIKAALPIISRSDRVFFHLGDKPFVEGDIIARVMGAYEAGQYSIIVPVHGGTKGHPVLVDMSAPSWGNQISQGRGRSQGLHRSSPTRRTFPRSRNWYYS